MRTIFLIAATAFCAGAQTSRTACTLSPATDKAVQSLPSLSDLSLSWEERIAPRRTLAQKEPGNWPLQIELQDAVRGTFHLGREWDRAIAMYRSFPDRVLGELLEARLLSVLHRKRSREMIERVLKAAPDSPWVHLAAVEWSAVPVGRDPAFGASHLAEFRRMCPDNLRAFAFLDLVQDPEQSARLVQDLRNRLDAKKRGVLAESDLFLFRAVWPWEKAAGGTEFPEKVRSDLASIRALSLYGSNAWYSTLRVGFEQILKDAAGLEALKDEVLKRAPTGQIAWWIEEERAMKQPGVSREEQDKALRERIARYGKQPFVRPVLTRLLLNPQSKLSDVEVERYADEVLDGAAKYPDQGSSWPPIQMLVAEVYAKRKIRLDRVPMLVQQGMEEIEYQEKYRLDSDAMPKMPGTIDNIAFAQSRAREILIRHALATEQADRAYVMLTDLRQRLEETKPANVSAPSADSWRRDHSTYLTLARLAGVEATPVAELVPVKPEAAERFPVGDFEARDLSGKVWRRADLKGKVAYVNVWTTWCGPCRGEMPGIQKLHDRWKSRKDRVMLTISADSREALARDFIREHKYSFPVVHGSAVAEKFFPPVMFPQNWLIDPEGRRLGITAPPAYDTTLEQIDRLADKLAP